MDPYLDWRALPNRAPTMPKPQQQHGTAPKHGATVTTTESQYEAEQVRGGRRPLHAGGVATLLTSLTGSIA